ncbi:MAG TPA: diguanylate cyclase [Kiritimatiellia bacterium]|nr:diguanylate cyclase [Kiritimatiellia bacterium]
MEILTGFSQFLLVTAIAFALLCLLISHLRFENLTRRATQSDDDMDPRDTFQVQIAHLLGTAHRMPEPFAVVFVMPTEWVSMKERYGAAWAEEALSVVEAQVRSVVRRTDTVLHYGEGRVGLIMETGRQHLGPILKRVQDAVGREPFRSTSHGVMKLSVQVGAATHPENGDRVRELIEQAVAAVTQAGQSDAAEPVLAPTIEKEVAPVPAAADSAQRSMLDPLTGVLREDRLGSAVSKFVARHRRDDRPVSLLLLDIDFLRRYNEHYGRDAGDGILRGLGEFLQHNARESDLLARYGGEEFLVVMGCAPRDALIAGQRLVAQMKRTPITAAGSSLKVSVSIGVAGFPDHGGNPARLLDAAETALFAAKERGRSLCLMYEPSMTPPPKGKPRDVF